MVCNVKTALIRPEPKRHMQKTGMRTRSILTTGISLLLGAVFATPVVHADSFFELSAGVHSDDNVSRGFLRSDRYADVSLDVDITAGRFYQLRPGRSVTVFGSLGASRFDKLDGFNAQALGLGASYQQKFGLGAYAPSAFVSLNILHHNSTGKTRDRDTAELEFSYSKRLSPAWSAMAGFVFEKSDGRNDGSKYASAYSTVNDIYDFTQRSAFASLEYAFYNQSLLSLSYTIVDGNTVSSALAPNPRLLAISEALTLDPAVPAPPGRNQVAYSLKTDAHLLALDWSIPVGRDTGFSIGYARQQIEARNGVNYRNDRISLKLLHAW